MIRYTKMIRYEGKQYRESAAAVIDDGFWRGEQLLFWIYAVVDSKTGSDLPAKAKRLTAKQWEKLPHEIIYGVVDNADVQAAIMDCIERGTCQYIAIEGKGWEPGVRKGATGVAVVHNTLEWILQFQNRAVVSGSKLIWAEITSQVRKPK